MREFFIIIVSELVEAKAVEAAAEDLKSFFNLLAK